MSEAAAPVEAPVAAPQETTPAPVVAPTEPAPASGGLVIHHLNNSRSQRILWLLVRSFLMMDTLETKIMVRRRSSRCHTPSSTFWWKGSNVDKTSFAMHTKSQKNHNQSLTILYLIRYTQTNTICNKYKWFCL